MYTFERACEKAEQITNQSINHNIPVFVVHDYENGSFTLTDKKGKETEYKRQKALAIYVNGRRKK